MSRMTEGIEFYKLSGSGNHFIIIPMWQKTFIKNLKAEAIKWSQWARQLCDPYQGVGADGVIYLKLQSNHSVRWFFYNADGSSANMCGNAARCVVYFLYYQSTLKKNSRIFISDHEVQFETECGFLIGTVKIDGRVQVSMPDVKWIKTNLTNEADGSAGPAMSPRFWLVDSGVPHVVVEWTQSHLHIECSDMRELASRFRFLPQLGVAGANVTFIQCSDNLENQEKNGQIHLISTTFERGIEGFTKACGTGAVAAAWVYSQLKGINNFSESVKVSVPGGVLEVSLDLLGTPVHLSGSVTFIFKGVLGQW